MKNYKSILREVKSNREKKLYDYQLPDEIVARIKQRLELENDTDLDFLLSSKYDVFKETFLDVYDFDKTREGYSFWEKVIADDDYESFYNLYPEINDNYDDSAKFLAAVVAVNEYIGWSPQGEPKGELFSIPIDVIYSMVYNQIIQGNPADVYVFEKNVLMAPADGGWNLSETDEGYNFWYDTVIDEKYKIYTDRYPDGQFIKDVFTDKGLKVWSKILGKSDTIVEINKKPIEDYVSKRMLQFEEKPKRELQEGDNRVDFFVETKDKEIQRFNKEFPDAEKPLKVLLGLLSKKEDERLKNLPEDVKKKAAEEKKKFKKQIQDKKQLKSIGVQVIDFKGTFKGMKKFEAPLSAQRVEDAMPFDNIVKVQYDMAVYNPEIKEMTSVDRGAFSSVKNQKDYNELLEYFFGIVYAGYPISMEATNMGTRTQIDEIKVKITYGNGETLVLTYDELDKFKPIPNKQKPTQEEKKEEDYTELQEEVKTVIPPFRVGLASEMGLDESEGKYYVIRSDSKYIAVKTKKLANMVMEDPDGFFKEYFDKGFVVDNITETQYKQYKENAKKQQELEEFIEDEDQDLEELKKEIDESCEMDLTLDALACELDELDDI